MRAAVTEGVQSMSVLDRPDPSEPGPGEVVITPEAVGICGSDYHFFLGELSAAAGGSQFPRVQGHEIGATIAAVGPDCREDLVVGQRVAVWPLRACGECYPCSIGRPNTCDYFELIGVHSDGGLQELLSVPAEQVYPIQADDPALAALAEPVSIAVRAVNRANIYPGERVVVLGAGPIGQCICLVARERGAEVLVVDLQDTRLALSRDMGAHTLGGRAATKWSRTRATGPRPRVRRWRSTRRARRRRSGRWSIWSRRPAGPCRSGCRATRSHCDWAA
jgi:threonine dehydrogenase-like Zn-dependent dehydrogenase